MATALALGSLISTGASAAAGFTGGTLTLGSVVGATGPVLPIFSVSAGTLGSIGAGLGLASTAAGMLTAQDTAETGFNFAISASEAELEATRARLAESRVAEGRERTQAALEEAARERALRRRQAARRAAFAGGAVDAFSGSAARIQEAEAGQINREQRMANLATDSTLNSIKINRLGTKAAGLGRSASLLSQARTNAASSRQTQTQNLVGLGRATADFASTIKSGGG